MLNSIWKKRLGKLNDFLPNLIVQVLSLSLIGFALYSSLLYICFNWLIHNLFEDHNYVGFRVIFGARNDFKWLSSHTCQLIVIFIGGPLIKIDAFIVYIVPYRRRLIDIGCLTGDCSYHLFADLSIGIHFFVLWIIISFICLEFCWCAI